MPPRPRPRPRVAVAESSASEAIPGPSNATSPSIPSSPPPNSSARIDNGMDDEDSHFMVNRARNAKSWKAMERRAKDVKVNESTPKRSDDFFGGEEDLSPRSRKRKHRAKVAKPLPSWTNSKAITQMLSEDDSDDESSSALHIDDTPKASRSKKRARSRSASITPPPELAKEQVQRVRNTVRQAVGGLHRPASPTNLSTDYSSNVIGQTIHPELASIARAIQNRPAAVPDNAGGGPEVVTVRVTWRPHPLDDIAKPRVFAFIVKRHDNLCELFEEVADAASVLSSSLVVSHEGKRIFAAASAHSLGAWAELVLEACDRGTHEYNRTHKHQRSPSVSRDDAHGRAPSLARSASADLSGADTDEESDASASQEKGKNTFKLTLRSATTKDVTLTVRPTTKCASIIKAFLKQVGLAEKGSPKKGGKQVGPRLMIDGDRLDPASEIGNAEVEDGDLVEVVGI